MIATHGPLARGIKDTLHFIIGEIDDLDILCAYETNDFSLDDEVDKIIGDLRLDDELVVLVDLCGGSVSNSFSRYINDTRVHILSGVNLPMLVEIAIHKQEKIENLISKSLEGATQGIAYVNDVVKAISFEKEDFDD